MLPLNILLVLLLVAILFFMLVAIVLLIFLGFRKSKSRKEHFAALVISSSGSPLPDVDVKLGNEIATTNSYGKAEFDISAGQYDMSISAAGHVDFRKTVRTGDQRIVTVKLSKDRAFPETKQLEDAVSAARLGREEIGTGYNPSIPDYMLGLCMEINQLSLEEMRTQPDQAARSECLRTAAVAISQITQGMVERRNLSLYAKSKSKKPKQVQVPDFRSPDIIEAKAKLSSVDSMITGRAGKKAISPPLVLWKIAERLLSKPTVFNIKLATLLLDSSEKMIKELGDYLL